MGREKLRENGDLLKSYKIKKNKTNQLINEARSLFYQNFIEDNNSNQQNLFTAAKKLINQGDKRTVFPPFVDKRRFADQMGNYFVEKIQDIQTKLNNMVQGLPNFVADNASETITPLHNFTFTQFHHTYGRRRS